MTEEQVLYWRRFEDFDAVVREHGGDIGNLLFEKQGVDAEHAVLQTGRIMMRDNRDIVNTYAVVGTGELGIPTTCLARAEPRNGDQDFYLHSGTFSRFRAYDNRIHETLFDVQDLGAHGLEELPPPVYSRNELRDGGDTFLFAVRDSEAINEIDRALERGGYEEKTALFPRE